MIETKEPITEKVLRDAKTGAYACPRLRTTRVFYIGVGDISPSRATEYAERTINAIKADIDTFNFENFFIVTSETRCRVEVLHPPVAPVSVAQPSPPPRRSWWKLRLPRVY